MLGASDRSPWSQAIFGNLDAAGFAGRWHPVNPRGGQVHGRPATTSCAAIGEAAELGVLMVPNAAIPDALRDLAAAGGRCAAILSSGFAEAGAAGAATQSDLAALARRLGIRLLGPNSLGFINFVDRAPVWTTPIRLPSRRDGGSILSQSGATAHFLANRAGQQDAGLAHVIVTGNEADPGLAELARGLLDDPALRAVALSRRRRRLPAYGVVRVRAIEELLATADIMGRCGVRRAGGLGIVSDSGGISEIAADTSIARGLAVPDLTAEASVALRASLPYLAWGLDRALAGLGHASAWSRRMREAPAATPPAPAPLAERPRAEHAALRCLRAAGVPVVPFALARDEAAAAAAWC